MLYNKRCCIKQQSDLKTFIKAFGFGKCDVGTSTRASQWESMESSKNSEWTTRSVWTAACSWKFWFPHILSTNRKYLGQPNQDLEPECSGFSQMVVTFFKMLIQNLGIMCLHLYIRSLLCFYVVISEVFKGTKQCF